MIEIGMIYGNSRQFSLPVPDGFNFGGVVTWISGLTFSVSETGFTIQNNPYVAPFSVITFDPADDTHPRIDVIAVDITGSVVIIKGNPAAEPLKPNIDPTTQLELTFLLIPANATEPAGVTSEIVYNENIEWVGSTSGVAVNFDSATLPFSGAKCADVGSIGTNDRIVFTAAAPKNFADYETFTAFIKLKEVTNKQYFLLLEFMLAGVPVSNAIVLLSASVSLEWQSLAIPISSFQLSGTQFDAVCLRWSKSGQQTDHAGFYLDMVKLEKGIQQPPVAIDTYVVELDFDEATNEIILRQNNNRPELRKVLPAGLDGKSAYEIAVENGFVGTEEEWLLSLEGEDGYTPIKDVDYFDGIDGINGITPHIGLNGNWWIDETDTGIKAEGTDGDDGREVEFQENAGWVEWRYVGEVSWTQLYEIPGGTLTKASGADITTGTDDAKYVTPKAITDSNVVQSAEAKLIVALTQAAYDALDPKVSTTLYLING